MHITEKRLSSTVVYFQRYFAGMKIRQKLKSQTKIFLNYLQHVLNYSQIAISTGSTSFNRSVFSKVVSMLQSSLYYP